MRLIYLPLEPYKERYTWYMSSVGGWAEDNFLKAGVDFVRVEGNKEEGAIKTGSVLDAYARSRYSFSQVTKVVSMIEKGEIVAGDVIYTEDFWTPGIEALFYIRQITGIPFKVGCFFHAQSVDSSDFTYPMRRWLRPIEQGLVEGYDYVFLASDILRSLCIQAGLDKNKLYTVGLPYNSDRLFSQLLAEGFKANLSEKEPFVLFSSRFDAEKNPHFFLDLVERCSDIQFRLVQPREKLSNDQTAEDRAKRMAYDRNNFDIIDTSNKHAYYDALCKASVQFNCAIQDWVSWTLLEAITFRCKPLYPIWKDFPRELRGFEETNLYKNRNLDDAEEKLRALLAAPIEPKLDSIVFRHDKTWGRFLEIMGLI